MRRPDQDDGRAHAEPEPHPQDASRDPRPGETTPVRDGMTPGADPGAAGPRRSTSSPPVRVVHPVRGSKDHGGHGRGRCGSLDAPLSVRRGHAVRRLLLHDPLLRRVAEGQPFWFVQDQYRQ